MIGSYIQIKLKFVRLMSDQINDFRLIVLLRILIFLM